MREALRLHQHQLITPPEIHFLMGYVYIGPPEPCDFQKIQAQIVASLHFLNKIHVSIPASTSTV